MKYLTQTIPATWAETYRPPRKRLQRQRLVSGTMEYSIPMLTLEEAPVAFILHDRGWIRHKENQDDTDYGPVDTVLYDWDDKLWSPVMESSKHARGRTTVPWSVEAMKREIACEGRRCRFGYALHIDENAAVKDMELASQEFLDAKKARIQEKAAQYVIINGLVCWRTGEPMYVVQTFGLGFNHGGTGAFIVTHYNPNISSGSYFRADEQAECIKYANKAASARGDTNNVGHFLEGRNIEVLKAECVKRNPAEDHGDGDPFINSCEGMIRSSGSQGEAALGVIALGLIGGK